MSDDLRLWRPVGETELQLVEASGWLRWPPRLPEQPIFYPVLNFAYAEQIARDWNSRREDHNFRGFVTMFDVDSLFAEQFRSERVGGKEHIELWVPAEELEQFNDHIVGRIQLVAQYANGEKITSDED